MSDVVVLDMNTSFQRADLARPSVAGEVDVIDLYDLPDADIRCYAGMVVPGLADQEFLTRHREIIRRWLDGGRVLAFSGQIFRLWLPGARPFVPSRIRSFHDYAVRIAASHPVFEGVREDDLTWRRGVAGFFARGWHPPPTGSKVIVRLATGDPVVYVDRVSCRGTLFVHAGNEILGYAGASDTSGRMARQLLAWMRAEARERMGTRT